MAEGLIARGHQLESWCPPTACRDYEPLADLMPEHVVEYRRTLRRKVNRFIPGRRGYGRQYLEMERHAKECARQIDAGGFDVSFVGNCQEFAVPPIGRYLTTSSLHYCQELMRALHEAIPDDEATASRSLGDTIKRVVLSYWTNWQSSCEHRDLAAFDEILVNSFYSKESLLRVHARESKVCYLGVDLSRFRLVDSVRKNTVLGLGAIQRHKDPRTAILAIAAIPEQDRPNLTWIGNEASENYVTELEVLAREKNVHLKLHHQITDRELVAELNEAAVLIYTSRLEPFGFAPLEANACGLAVVAIGEGGVRETVRDGFNGIIVPNRDPSALGGAVLDLIKDPKKAESMGKNGREWVGQYWTWKRCIENLEQFLMETAGLDPKRLRV